MTLVLSLLCLALTLCTASPLQVPFSNADNELLSSNTTSYIDQVRKKWGVPGITLALVVSPTYTRSGWKEEALSFGKADVRGNAVTPDSLFSIASNSKLFTMLSVGLLIHNETSLPNGQTLDWSTKVKDILPEWQLMDTYASDHADVLDLMLVCRDMIKLMGASDHLLGIGISTPSEIVANMRHLKPSYELRQTWQYNNQHYITLSHIIPTLTGQPFPDFVKEHIFDPLGMTDATYNATAAKLGGQRTEGFLRKGINATLCAERWTAIKKLDQSCLGETKSIDWWTESDAIFEAGAGGVILSAADMVKWVRELLSPQVLPKYLIDKAVSPLMVVNPRPVQPEESARTYGLAQWVYNYRGYKIEGHTGDLPGQESIMLRVPEKGVGIMLAVNDGVYGTAMLAALANVILDDLLGLTPVDWEDRILFKEITESSSFPDIPAHPRSPPKSSNIVGQYSAPGYGAFNLSLLAQIDKSHSWIPHISTMRAHSDKLNLTGPIYYAETNKAVSSHLIFTHFDGPLFNWTAANLFPVYGPKGKTDEWVVNTSEGTGTAVLTDREGGIGMFGNYWGKSQVLNSGPVVTEFDVKDHAEVWYGKI